MRSEAHVISIIRKYCESDARWGGTGWIGVPAPSVAPFSRNFRGLWKRCGKSRESVTLAGMLALKLRDPAPVEDVGCDEYWIGDVEACGDDWTFSVIGPDEAIETFVHDSQAAAECARARMFRMLCPAVAVAIGGV